MSTLTHFTKHCPSRSLVSRASLRIYTSLRYDYYDVTIWDILKRRECPFFYNESAMELESCVKSFQYGEKRLGGSAAQLGTDFRSQEMWLRMHTLYHNILR